MKEQKRREAADFESGLASSSAIALPSSPYGNLPFALSLTSVQAADKLSRAANVINAPNVAEPDVERGKVWGEEPNHGMP